MTTPKRKLASTFYGGLSAVVFALGCAQASLAGEAQSISWAIYDLAPSYFVSSAPTYETLGDGIGDNLLKLLVQALPEYEHKFSVMTMPRIMAEMKADKPLCVLNVQLTPERAKIAYATPLLKTPGPQLVLSKQLLARHPEWKNGVSLAAISADPALRGQYQIERAYGENLNKILQSPANVGLKPNSSASASNALRMIEHRRADYTIEYPELLEWSVKRRDIPDSLTSLPILEAAPFLDSYVLCTRSEWGAATTQRIDAELRKLAATPAYRQALERWLPKDELRVHKYEYQQFYRNRAKTLACDPACP
ncbi:TIGR02285 family protein [Duganella qianjiadongensis]|uniref:TIGR02285 family protein n=1 Tax=Duganella qianjiadongensis TaxID=2692176 RepID=A0ABW9VQU5_9BURK|nr:TIGR02285 family protein [Duganella qianjiadongensis]MYM41077.1 TIGR02285 family protein [Duganella qianjiadongensis]